MENNELILNQEFTVEQASGLANKFLESSYTKAQMLAKSDLGQKVLDDLGLKEVVVDVKFDTFRNIMAVIGTLMLYAKFKRKLWAVGLLGVGTYYTVSNWKKIKQTYQAIA